LPRIAVQVDAGFVRMDASWTGHRPAASISGAGSPGDVAHRGVFRKLRQSSLRFPSSTTTSDVPRCGRRTSRLSWIGVRGEASGCPGLDRVHTPNSHAGAATPAARKTCRLRASPAAECEQPVCQRPQRVASGSSCLSSWRYRLRSPRPRPIDRPVGPRVRSSRGLDRTDPRCLKASARRRSP
jgi:hypothetical protein